MKAEKTKENLHAGHRQRMMERFRREGFDGWQPHEVLEVLLYPVLPRVNTNPHGHRLIRKFKSVKNVLEADPEQLRQIEGLGPASAAYLLQAREDISARIREQFQGSRDLDKYHLSFLVDWFMRDSEKPVGILICDEEEAFCDFLCLPVSRTQTGEIDAAAMFREIAYDVTNRNFMLFLRKQDILTESDIFEIRRYNFGRSFILSEVYILKGREPVPLLHPEKTADSVHIVL